MHHPSSNMSSVSSGASLKHTVLHQTVHIWVIRMQARSDHVPRCPESYSGSWDKGEMLPRENRRRVGKTPKSPTTPFVSISANSNLSPHLRLTASDYISHKSGLAWNRRCIRDQGLLNFSSSSNMLIPAPSKERCTFRSVLAWS